jgi:hypothetical protein
MSSVFYIFLSDIKIRLTLKLVMMLVKVCVLVIKACSLDNVFWTLFAIKYFQKTDKVCSL